MSGYPLNFPSDAAKLRQNYLANLSLQANINDMNLQANKIFKKTGQTPTQPTDNRTTAEKLADVERLKIDINSRRHTSRCNCSITTTTRITVLSTAYRGGSKDYQTKI